MLAIICPSCGNLNQFGIDDEEEVDCEVCARCGCDYREFEEEVEELH